MTGSKWGAGQGTAQVPINAKTVHVGTGTNFSDLPNAGFSTTILVVYR
jgi:hypothetical protein